MEQKKHQKGLDLEYERGRQMPGRNPKGDRSAGRREGRMDREHTGARWESDVQRGRRDPGYKRQPDETRR